MCEKTSYQKSQNFNKLIAWFHSLRYKKIREICKKYSLSNPIRIIDIGCAHGELFGQLNKFVNINYTGVDLDRTFVEAGNRKFDKFTNFKIYCKSASEILSQAEDVDLIIALEVLEHIPDDEVSDLLSLISQKQPKMFVFSVPVEIGPAVWFKNLASFLMGYPRYKEYTFKETLWAGLNRLDKLPPHQLGHKGFSWKNLLNKIGAYMEIKEIYKFPFQFLPASLSTSIFGIARPFNQ